MLGCMSVDKSGPGGVPLACAVAWIACALPVLSQTTSASDLEWYERTLREELPIGELTEEDVIAALVDEVIPFIER